MSVTGTTTINSSSTLQVKVNMDTTSIYSSGDSLTITFPQSGYLTTTGTCTIVQPSTITVSCSITTTTITVSLSYSSTSSKQVIFNVSLFKNPSSTSTISSITVIRTYNGSTLESGTASISNITPDSLTSVTLTPYDTASDLIGYSSATMKVSFVNKNTLSSNFKITVKFPLWNPNSNTNNQLPMLASTSPTCTGTTNMNIGSSCSFSSSTNILTLESITSTTYSSGSTFTFTVNNIRNPYSAKPIYGFTVTTYTQSGGSIDTLSSSISYTVTTKTTIDSLDLVLLSSSINAQTTYYFSYVLNLPIDQYCRMIITGPTDLNIAQRFTYANGASVFSSSTSNATAEYASNTITINGCYNGYTEQDNNYDTLNIYYIQNPGQVKDSGTFTFQLYALDTSGNQYIIAEDTDTIYVEDTQLTPGSITGISITPVTTYEVQEFTTFQIKFTLTNDLLSTSIIVIYFPTPDTIFKLTDTTTCTLSSVSSPLTTTPTSCKIASNIITISEPFGSSTYTGGNQLYFTISGGYNPMSVVDPGTFYIYTYNVISSTSYQVDYGSGTNQYTPTAGTITDNLSVVSTSYVNYQSGVEISIQFSPKHYIPKNGVLIIKIPTSDIIVYSSSLLTSIGYISTDTGSDVEFASISYSSSTSKVTITDAFSTSAWTPGTTGTYVTVKLYGLRNPRTLSKSTSFQVTTCDSSSNTIDEVAKGLTLQMTTLNELNSVTVTPASQVNGATCDYTIEFNPSTPLYTNEIFTLTFPNEISLPSSISCTPTLSVSCVSIGQKLKVTILSSSGAPADTTFSFVAKSITNPPSTEPTSVFTSIYTTDSSDNQISQYTSKTIQITNTIPATVSTSSLYQTDQTASADTTYTITYTTINAMESGASFVVEYLSIAPFASSATTCYVVYNGVQYPMTCVVSQAALKITMNSQSSNSLPLIPAGTSLQLALSKFTNPSDSSNTASMSVISYTDSTTTYSYDKVTSNLVPGLECDNPCKTCLSSNTASCTSCYTDGSTTYKYYLSTSSTCSTSCPTSYYANSNYECKSCLSKCLTCSSSTTCDTCSSSGSYPYYYNSMCYSTCPSGTYSDTSNKLCYACSSPCAECTGSGNGKCTSCLSSTDYDLLEGTTCVSECSSGYVKSGSSCLACTSPCLTCQTSQTVCTSCKSGYFLYGLTCISKCPSGFLANYSTYKCDGCTSNCQTCSGKTTICIKCLTGFSLYNDACYYNCPTGYYSSKSVCVKNTTSSNNTSSTNNTNSTNSTTNSTQQTNITISVSNNTQSGLGYPYLDLGFLIYFPGSILFGIGALIALGSYFKDKNSYISANTIAINATIELLALGVQIFLGYFTEKQQLNNLFGGKSRLLMQVVGSSSQIPYGIPLILIFTAFAFGMNFLLNVVWGVINCCYRSLNRDEKFVDWKKRHKTSVCCTYGWSVIWSYKMGRFLYSRFLGRKGHSAEFVNPQKMLLTMNFLSIANIIFCLLPVIFIDIYALSVYKWGSQFYIALIDTLIISILMFIYTIIDFKVGRSDQNMGRPLLDDSQLQKLHEFSSVIDEKLERHKQWWERESQKINQFTPRDRSVLGTDDDLDKKLRRDALQKIIENISPMKDRIPSGMDLSRQEKIEDDIRMRRYSDEPEQNEKEEVDQRAHSYPVSPKVQKDFNGLLQRLPSSMNRSSLGFPKDQSIESDKHLSNKSLIEKKSQKSKISQKSNQIHPQQSQAGSKLSTNKQSLKNSSHHHLSMKSIDQKSSKQSKKELLQTEEKNLLDNDYATDDEDQNQQLQHIQLHNNEELKETEENLISQQNDENDLSPLVNLNNLDPEPDLAFSSHKDSRMSKKTVKFDDKLMDEERVLSSLSRHNDTQMKNRSQQSLKEIDKQSEVRLQTAMKSQIYQDSLNSISMKSSQDKMETINARDENHLDQNGHNIDIKSDLEVLANELEIDDNEYQDNEVREIITKSSKELFHPDLDENDHKSDQKQLQSSHSKNSYIQSNKDAISKLSVYEKELDINQNEQMEQQSEHEDINNENSDKTPKNEGRISAMIQNFEEENPDLLKEQDEENDQPPKTPLSEINQIERFSALSIDAPPNASNRNFNENDIMGDFDHDEKGNIILLENPKGEIVDKNGQKVNNKGYLLDKDDQIIEREKNRVMFTKDEIDEDGEIPAPFCLEKFNFNPFEILGNLDYNDHNLRPVEIPQRNDGQLIDKNQREVNRSGFITDKDGNLIDRKDRRKFDRRHLIKNDDIPHLLNYKGKKFDIRDVMGDFNRDPNTGDPLFRRNGRGQYFDKQNRPVNKRGYLIDKNCNIIDKKGRKIWDKVALTKDGEFPKIFPFSRFKIDQIQGDYELDPVGNPLLFRDKNGNLRDQKGRLTNDKGYLIDKDGNIVDKKGNLMFKKDILTQDGDIPKVFRMGLLRKDTRDSFSRIMSEIDELEKRQGSDYENEYQVSPDRKGHKLNKSSSSSLGGNTSIASNMEDTPSNYNIPNGRLDIPKAKRQHGTDDESEVASTSTQRNFKGRFLNKHQLKTKEHQQNKQRRMEAQKQSPQKYIPPDRESQMSKAYEKISKSNTKKNQKKPQYQQSRLSQITQSISGFYKDPNRNLDGLSSVMKESDLAHKIPNYKEKRKQQIDSEWNGKSSGRKHQKHDDEDAKSDSMLSLYSQSDANFKSMIRDMKKQQQTTIFNEPKRGKKKLRNIEHIYLQRLEPLTGRKTNAPKINKEPRFRECHDRVWNVSTKLAEDLTVRDEITSLIVDNYKNMAGQLGELARDPSMNKLVDIKKIALLKDKIMRDSSNNSGLGSRNDSVIDEEGLNIFYGNRKQYKKERDQNTMKIEIGKKNKIKR